MKKILSIIPITLFALLLLTGLGNQKCWADSLDGSGLSILLIDGDDYETSVTFTIFNFGVSGDVDHSINGGDWTDVVFSGTPPTAQLTYYGGDTLDFRLSTDGPASEYYSYNSTDATLTYSGSIPSTFAQKPTRDDPYYGTVMVDWSTDGDFQLEVLTTPEVYDGFAPVPIPKSLLLLGAGLLGLIGFGFRRRKARIT